MEMVLLMSESAKPILVPFLVIEDVTMPIIGYNVIEEVVKEELSRTNAEVNEVLSSAMKSINKRQVDGIINLIQKKIEDPEPEYIGIVKTGSKNVIIPKGISMKISCISHCGTVAKDMPVIFQPNLELDLQNDLIIGEGVITVDKGKTCRFVVPVSNSSLEDIVLSSRTSIGKLVAVSSIIPVPVGNKNFAEMNTIKETSQNAGEINQMNTEAEDVKDDDWLKNIKLEHLTPVQKSKVMDVLIKEHGVFSKGEGDIGRIEGLKLKINLKDPEPVKRNYTSIPRPLYKEVKEYVEDLLARNWVQKSCSSYSSPMVCVRKKDGSLRLCIDYRQLNSKTYPDRQPIPKVMDVLNNLGGNSWFTSLDMSKAYHQGFMEEESRHLTAFATPWSLLQWIRIPSCISALYE